MSAFFCSLTPHSLRRSARAARCSRSKYSKNKICKCTKDSWCFARAWFWFTFCFVFAIVSFVVENVTMYMLPSCEPFFFAFIYRIWLTLVGVAPISHDVVRRVQHRHHALPFNITTRLRFGRLCLSLFRPFARGTLLFHRATSSQSFPSSASSSASSIALPFIRWNTRRLGKPQPFSHSYLAYIHAQPACLLFFPRPF